MLIQCVSPPGGTLIDLAVGKGGDIPKWNGTSLKFIYGLDVSKDNIENRINGVCSRYLTHKKKNVDGYDAMFLQANSSLNIRNGEAFTNEKSKIISDGIYGQNERNIENIGKMVYENFGVGKDGFDVCSIQFALHYMFENKNTLHSFIKNVCENVKIGGHFIGCAYDGKKILKLFNDKKIKENESYSIYEKESKLWEITRRFKMNELPNDEKSLGLTIEVYQETFAKVFKEYLINYDYFDSILENYGFARLNKEELSDLGLDKSYSFQDLFTSMRSKSKGNKEYGMAPKMKPYEKEISFLNNTFVFRKIREVDVNMVYNSFVFSDYKGEEPKVEEPKVEEPKVEEEKTLEELEKEQEEMSDFKYSEEPEFIIMMGYPHSGRSEMAKDITQNEKYELFSDKVYDPITKSKKIIQEKMNEGKSIVVDSTNSSIKVRKEFVNLAKKNKYPITCIHHNKSYEETIEYNNTLPKEEKLGKIKFTVYKRNYEEPNESEGFKLKTF